MSLASLEWGRAAGGGRKRGFKGFVVDMPLLLILFTIVGLGLVVLYSAAIGNRGIDETFVFDPDARDAVLRQGMRFMVGLAAFFVLVNASMLVAWFHHWAGTRVTMWEPTRR